MATSPPPLTPVQPKTWALCAVCHKSGSRRVIAEGTEAEMESVFDLIVRRGYGLQIIDSDGSLHCTTAGPVYVPDPAPGPSNRPEAADVSMDQIARRLSALEDFANDKGFRLDTINRRLNRLEVTTADHDSRIADVNRAMPQVDAITYSIAARLIDALAELAPKPAN